MCRHAFSFDFRKRSAAETKMEGREVGEGRAAKDEEEEEDEDEKEEEDHAVHDGDLTRTTSLPLLSTQRHRRGPSHRAKASAIIQRTIAAPGSFEFCLNLEVNGEHVPQKAIPRMSLPADGTLWFEVAAYVEHAPIEHRSFLSVCENLASQSTAQQRQLYLECLLQGGDAGFAHSVVGRSANGTQQVLHGQKFARNTESDVWFLAEQVEVMMRMLDDPQQRWRLLCTVSERILDCVNLVLGVHDALTSRRHHKRLLRWISKDVSRLAFDVVVSERDVQSMTMRRK